MRIPRLPKSLFQIYFLGLIGFFGLIQNLQAHTVLEIPTVTENKRLTNSIYIGHGCSDSPVIGSSIVIPDGTDSIISTGLTKGEDAEPYNGTIGDFVFWGNSIQLLQNRSVFSEQDEKTVDSNVVGFWSGGGRGVSANLNAYIPFILNSPGIKSESCALSVRFAIAIADVCKITPFSGITDSTAVNLWTPAVGSKYDGLKDSHAYNSPAFLTIERDLTVNPLPERCGAGLHFFVKPSAAQVDRDMPIIFNGTQVWPAP